MRIVLVEENFLSLGCGIVMKTALIYQHPVGLSGGSFLDFIAQKALTPYGLDHI